MDRISNLPDELLCHILSFLTAKEGALTLVLSTRWQNLFALVPSLDIDDSLFLHPEEGKREKGGILECFMDFVDRVLALQGDIPIEKLSTKCKTDVVSVRVNQWIRNVLKRGVLCMDLFIDLGYRYELPLEIFVSNTLVKLKIGHGFPLQLRRANISLPMLKTLFLEHMSLNDGQLQMILSACPVLVELFISNIHMVLGNETISSASLETLTMIECANHLRSFSLDTPNLHCLNCSDSVAGNYPVVNLGNLAEAQIDLGVMYYHIEVLSQRNDDTLEDDIFLRLGNVKKLVRGFFNVKKLYLSPGTLQALALCCQAIPVFNNLTFLEIESCMNIAWQAMPVLLRNCPNLETLVIKGGILHCVTNKCGDACISISREEKGRSLVSCLVKRLEIRGFDGLTTDLEMIKHFLECFPCLKEMEIYIRETRQRFTAPLIPELNSEMLMRYNDKLGRSANVKIKVHGSFPWERTSQ